MRLCVECRSASGRDLTGHNKLDRSISGPLSMTGGLPPSSKKQEPKDLSGAAIEPEDEEGLSAAEVECQAMPAAPRVACMPL